ncbi:MAG: DUF2628 domain-containing protein, partial [Anaplasmataceae bacterium]|nr:DUF2628 domain-containing protein [Anaplasmataceae bacterium]
MKKFLVCAKKIENQLNSSNHDDYFYKSLKIIKEGFNINAFLFGIFWTLYKSLWYESLLIFTL